MGRVAIVNDDTDFLALMGELLRERGWDAITLREADSAYSELKQMPPDLIILDIRMGSPEKGWSILELLTLDPEMRHIPVIVCSAAIDDLESRHQWLSDHGIASLPKPFDIDDLYVVVDAAIRRSTTAHSAE